MTEIKVDFIPKCAECGSCDICAYQGIEKHCDSSLCKRGWEGYFKVVGTSEVKDPEQGWKKGHHPSPTVSNNPLDVQVGGGHYKSFAIQPVEFCQKNKLNTCESNIVKYACRHKTKGGAEDVKKIIHYAQLILKMEYNEDYDK